MEKLRWIILAVTAIVGVGAAVGANDPIAERRALMRDNQKQERSANNLILGKFLPEKATAAMQKLQANMAAFVELFPEGSDSGGETKAAPSIWANLGDFRALAARTVEHAKAAEAQIAAGQDAFTLAWQAVAEDCTACHVKYTQAMMIR